MGVAFFGFGLMLTASLVGWVLEKIGVMETPAHELRSFTESSHHALREVPAQPLHGFAGSSHGRTPVLEVLDD